MDQTGAPRPGAGRRGPRIAPGGPAGCTGGEPPGGGGFLILLARGPEAAEELRKLLRGSQASSGGAVYDWRIARGLQIIAGREGDMEYAPLRVTETN